MIETKKRIALALYTLLVLLGGLLIFTGFHEGKRGEVIKTPQEENVFANITLGKEETYTLDLAPNSTIIYNITYLTSEGYTAQTTVYVLTITKIDWPLIEGNYTIPDKNTTSPAKVAIGNLILPRELLGQGKISVPIVLPSGVNTAVCANLTLTGEKTMVISNTSYTVYMYSLNISRGEFIINGTLAYEASNGLLVSANFTMTGQHKSLFHSRQYIINYTVTGSEKVKTPSDWLCMQPYSSDLRFTLEGAYLLSNGSLTPASIDSIREATLDDGIIAVVVKNDQPINNIFWKNLLKVSKLCPGRDLYVIVGGPLSSDTEIAMAQNILEKAGSQTSGVVVKFAHGVVEEEVFSYDTAGKLASLICGHAS